jgi:ADP-ribosylglycohydrolase
MLKKSHPDCAGNPPPGEVCNFVATNPTKPLKALSAALWTYFNADKFETGLLALIHEGGDADTYTSLA